MNNEEKALWAAQDAWTEKEFTDLLCGLPPDGTRASTAELNLAAEAIDRAVHTGRLAPINKPDTTDADLLYRSHRLFWPAEATRWATANRSRFPAFPFTSADIPDYALPHADLKKKERDSYLLMIAALLSCIAGELPDTVKHPSFSSEAKLIDAIAHHYDGYSGLSKSNLSRRFPQAKHALKLNRPGFPGDPLV